MAGFPCQAFSLAGKRLGTEDVRGQVIYYIMEILKEKRPEHVLLENVRGLLSWNKGELFNWIIRELKKMYSTVQYKVLNSKDYGVPQNRERIFIYATNREVPFGWNFIPKKQELKLKLKDMLEENVDEKYYLSKEQYEYSSNYRDGKPFKQSLKTDIAGCITTKHPKRACSDTNLIKIKSHPDYKNSNSDIKEICHLSNSRTRNVVFSGKSISPCLNTAKGGGLIPLVLNQQLNEEEVVTEDGLEFGIVTVNPIGEPIQNSAEIGEPIQNSAEIGEAKRIYSEKGLSPCIKKSNIIVHSKQPRTSKTGKVGTGHLCKNGETSYCLDKGNSQYIEYENNIRVLTPLECFRLQGFKDNEINLDSLSDTAKYELAGNGWTLTVVEEIEKKIFNYLLI
jgi:DNA (cytosine-5)-methyltransferase 1